MTHSVDPPPGYHQEPLYHAQGLRGRQFLVGPGRRFDWRHWAHQDRTLWILLLIGFTPLVWLLYFA